MLGDLNLQVLRGAQVRQRFVAARGGIVLAPFLIKSTWDYHIGSQRGMESGLEGLTVASL